MSPDFRLPPTVASPLTSGLSGQTSNPGAVPLELLRPIDAQGLPNGVELQAQVLKSEAKGAHFELLLRLAALAGQPPREILANSRQALPEGAQLLIQLISQTRATASLLPAQVTAPLTRLDPALFPAGSLIQARVLSQQPLPAQAEQARFALLVRLLQGGASGALLSLVSSRALEPGSLLTAQVGAAGELRVVGSQTQQLQLGLMQGLRDSFMAQGSAAPLLRLLENLSAQPPAAGRELQPAMRQVLEQISNLSQLNSEAGVNRAIRQSGIFLEADLARLATALGSKGDNLPPLNKLLPLLASMTPASDAPALPGSDLKLALLNLLTQIQRQLPGAHLPPLLPPPGPWQALPAVRPGLFPLPNRVLSNLAEAPDLGSLLRLTAALLARIQHQQFQSLGQTQSFADGSSQTVWQLDIPLRDGQQFQHVQVRIQRDDPAPNRKAQELQPQWEIRLAFDLDQLGPLHCISRLKAGRVSSEFWTEQPLTLALLEQELGHLRTRLLGKGLEVAELSCHAGLPPEPRQSLQQRWIDEVT
ncbi:hypothetical protein BVH74_16185 [Halopseudomonas phragmitis]|uniref:Flagellar hook-length control protein-like C-terminal domain-containing protein n=1 Tax=Halopseudomonas phragmitis TaxID=1931241 RepID=A0A1V0B8D5_9GAMM|nr:hypothetical protein BVH74_16185 [Halopseudomonas phragmitis]